MPAKRAKQQPEPRSAKSARTLSDPEVIDETSFAATVHHQGTLAITAKSQKDDSYPLLPEWLAVEHEGEPPCAVWPVRSLLLKYCALDGGPGRDDMVRGCFFFLERARKKITSVGWDDGF